MPTDAQGNSADVVMDANSTIARTNLARLHEQFYNATSREIANTIRREIGFTINDPSIENKVRLFSQEKPQQFDALWKYLIDFYKIVSPDMYLCYTAPDMTRELQIAHLASIKRECLTLYVPPERDVNHMHVVRDIMKSVYKPLYGPVTYVGNSGKRVTTVEPVLIGSLYFFLLEQTGDNWSAVSSGRYQNMGVLAPLSKADKYSQPVREQVTKIGGETELRLLNAFIEPEGLAEFIDRNNNPASHRMEVQAILNADKPTNIERTVDRTKIPFGKTNITQFINHLLFCRGMKFSYRSNREDENKNA